MILVDAKVGLRKMDKDLWDMLDELKIAYVFVLTKWDKVREARINKVIETLKKRPLDTQGKLYILLIYRISCSFTDFFT